MATVAGSEASTLMVHQGQTVNRKIGTTTVGCGTAQERTTAAELPGPVKAPTETARRVILSRKAGALAGKPR